MRASGEISATSVAAATETSSNSSARSSEVQEMLFRKMMGIAAAAHELKTPLSLLSGYTHLLLDGSLGELNPQQRRVLNEMESGATRLQRFINDFLAFGALEAGKCVANKSVQDLNGTLREVIQMWGPRFEGGGKHLYLNSAEDLPLIPYDELKIQHVLSNLLDNALKFTPKAGSVQIATRTYFWDRRLQNRARAADRRKNADRKDNAVRIDVRDSGPGIPTEEHLEIFSEFKRLNSGPNSEGIGLGLAIAKRLVDAHAGRIWVESGSGPGAMFSVLLPMS